MNVQAFWEGVLAGYGIAVPVGAIAVLILDTGIRQGLAEGMRAGAGAATADLIYAAVAAVGGTLLQAWLLPVADVFRILGGVVLIAIGVFGLWRSQKPLAQPVDHIRQYAGQTFLSFLGLTLLNPLTIVYFSALILGDLNAQRTFMAQLLFVLGAGLASLSWQWIIAGFGALAGKTLPSTVVRWLSALGNLVVIVLGIRLLIPG
jgi:threonine/homoserine/homoserine lactone efflux protein